MPRMAIVQPANGSTAEAGAEIETTQTGDRGRFPLVTGLTRSDMVSRAKARYLRRGALLSCRQRTQGVRHLAMGNSHHKSVTDARHADVSGVFPSVSDEGESGWSFPGSGFAGAVQVPCDVPGVSGTCHG
jgi:hypothetical protein